MDGGFSARLVASWPSADLLPVRQIRMVAVPLMTGGAPIHALAVEVHLRPLLVELGATVPARGLYVTEPEFTDPSPAIGRWAEAAVPLLRRALG